MTRSWFIATMLAAALGTSGCSRQKEAMPLESSEAAPDAWSMDLNRLLYPGRPAAGKIHGQEFRVEEAKLEYVGDAAVLKFRQGKDFVPDRDIHLAIFDREPDSLGQGLTLQVGPDAGLGRHVPHVHLHWLERGRRVAETEIFMNKYALKLDLAKLGGDKLPGKIYLCLPDAAHSYVAGTFLANVSLAGFKVRGQK